MVEEVKMYKVRNKERHQYNKKVEHRVVRAT